MNLIPILSGLLGTIGVLWCCLLWGRLRDWRLLLLAAFQVVTLIAPAILTVASLTESSPPDQRGQPPTRHLFHLTQLGGALMGLGLVKALSGSPGLVRAGNRHLGDRGDQSLRDQYAELDLIYRTAPIGLCLLDTDLRIVRVNETLSAINGMSVERHLGRSICEVLPDVSDHLQPALRNLVERGEPILDLNINFPDSDNPNQSTCYRASFFPLRDAGGRVIGVSAFVTDVTEIMRATDALRKSEARFHLAVKGSSLGIWEWDIATGSNYWSPQLLELLGLTRTPLRPSFDQLLDRVHPSDREMIVSAISAHQVDGVPYSVEVRLRCAEDRYRWFRARGASALDRQGIPKRMAGCLEDIHEQHIAVNELRDRERRMNLIADSLPVLIAYVDSDLRYQYVNATCQKWWDDGLGYTDPQPVGKHISEAIGEEAVNATLASMERLRAGETIKYELPLVVRNGSTRRRQTTVVPHLADDGEFLGYYGLTADVTDLVAARQESQDSRETMRLMLEGTARATGADFFPSLVQHLAGALGYRYLLVARVDDVSPATVTTLAFCDDGKLTENVSFEIADMPCARVVSQSICFCSRDVQKEFPQASLLAQLGVQSYHGTPLVSSAGETLGVLVAMHDHPMESIPDERAVLEIFADRAAAELERINMEETLRKSELLHRSVIELSPSAIVVLSGDSIQFANAAAVKMIGADSPDSLLNQPAASVIVAEDRELVADRIRHVIVERATTEPVEIRLQRFDGRQVEVEAVGAPIEFEGEPAVLAMAFDISHRKRIERALRLTQHSVEKSHTGILWITRGGGFAYANDAACEILGYGREELLAKRAGDLRIGFERTDRPEFWAHLRETNSVAYETVFQRRDSERVYVSVSGTHLEFGGQEYLFAFLSDVSAGAIAEAARCKNEELLELTNRLALVGGWEIDLATMQLRWTAQTCRIHEVPVDFVPNLETAINFYAPEGRPTISAAVEKAMEDGTPWDLELPLITANGNDRWVRANGALDLSAGKPGRLHGAFQDITERKLAEIGLKRRFEFEALLARTSSALIDVSVGEIGRELVSCLSQLCHFFGMDRAVVAEFSVDGRIVEKHQWAREGKPHTLQHVTPQDLKWIESRWAAGQPILISSASQLPSEANAERVAFAANRVESFLGIPLMINGHLAGCVAFDSERCQAKSPDDLDSQIKLTGEIFANALTRRRNDEALRASEERYRTLYERTPAMLHSIDADGNIVNVSDHWLDTMGYRREEVIGRPSLHFLTEESRRFARETCVPKFVETQQLKDEEFQVMKKDGEVMETLLSAVAERDDRGAPSTAHVVVIDVTERKRAQEESRQHRDVLAHMTRLSTMGELVAGIAHEVKQPLYAITNFAAAVSVSLNRFDGETKIPDGQLTELKEWNQSVRAAASRASEIINRLREFSRKGESRRERRAVGDIIHDSIELVAFEARQCQVVVETVIPQKLPCIYVDSIQCEQVIVNLLHNAYEALAECDGQRRVWVEAAEVEDEIEVRVIDNGPGIDREHHAKLIEAFYTTKSHGMGMGLAISQTILENHNGRLWATENRHGGATFHITLPKHRADQIPPQNAPPATTPASAPRQDAPHTFTGRDVPPSPLGVPSASIKPVASPPAPSLPAAIPTDPTDDLGDRRTSS